MNSAATGDLVDAQQAAEQVESAVVQVLQVKDPNLDPPTRNAIRKALFEAWLAERRHDDLNTAEISDTGFSRVFFDLAARRKKWSVWETTFRRDDWFQEQILRVLNRRYRTQLAREPGVFFLYFYFAPPPVKLFCVICLWTYSWEIFTGSLVV